MSENTQKSSGTLSLEDYVAETLLAICKGVEKAQNRSPESFTVNPVLSRHGLPSGAFSNFIGFSKNDEPILLIDFDVSVVVTKSSSGDAKISVSLFGQGGGVDGGLKHVKEYMNKISFKVPIQYRTQKS